MHYSTKSLVMLYLVALALTVGSHQQVLVTNDWLVPCVCSHCLWDMPANCSVPGTLQIVCFRYNFPTQKLKITPHAHSEASPP